MGLNFFQISDQNPKVFAFGFIEKGSLWQKLIETPYFMALYPYSGSVIHNGHIHKLLHILKKLKFCPKIQRLAFHFTEKGSLWQKLTETPYFLVVKHIFRIGYT
jgi:hypothetical protein